MKTYVVKAKELDERWHVLDAAERPLGRLASEAAQLLRGKHRANFSPHMDHRDFVVIVNAAKVRVTGRKPEQKTYYRHTQYPGGLKQVTLGKLMAIRPERVVERAVRGMLPRNHLGDALYRHLKVYAGPEHPHQAQVNVKPKPQPQVAAEAPETTEGAAE